MKKQDWILENIKRIIRDKGIKVTTIANAIGKSQGEVSKILAGERENYTQDLYKWTEPLGENFHDLVQNNAITQNNYGEVKDHGVVNVHTLNKSDNSLYEERLKDKEEIIKIERKLSISEYDQKVHFKDKYYRAKEKIKELESKLKSFELKDN